MPKRPSGGRDSGRKAKRRRQHLYLVFDDWFYGYSIRKVDLSPDSDSDNGAEPPQSFSDEDTEQRLPPAFFRLEARPTFPENFVAAFGTKIIAMPHCMHWTDNPPWVPMIDIRTRGISFIPQPKVQLMAPIFFPVGDKLFVLSADCFQVLHPPPVEEDGHQRWEGCWCKLPKHPFDRWNVTSYALHPDGRTIFVSTRSRATSSTFTYDTADAEAPSNWKQHGEWVLPFTGRAHFDCRLEAWVGLSGDQSTSGYLCACDVASAKSDGSDSQCPSWKLSKENLFSQDPFEKHVGATLVYMGGRSKFCLAQFVSIEDESGDECNELDEPAPCRYLICLTTFSLRFDKNGDLTTGGSHRVRCFKVPIVASGHDLHDPTAFWM